MRPGLGRFLTMAFFGLLLSGLLPAQGPGDLMPTYPFSNFRFNFINPGGRATAMGQAFIALGDDATGSETNPAGLTALLTPQLFLEGRAVSNSFFTLEPTETRIQYDEQSSTRFSPTFISAVIPFRKWAFGAYRQELANYSVDINQPTAPVPGVYAILFPEPQPVKVVEFQSRMEFSVINYGCSLAYRMGERLNFGFSLRASGMKSDVREVQPENVLEGTEYIPEGDANAVRLKMSGTAWDVSWVAGLIVKPLNWLKIGAVYRRGSTHRFHAVFDENVYSRLGDVPQRVDVQDFSIVVPDRYGFGLAFLPSDEFTLTFDVIRIEYGEMTPNFVNYIQEEFQDDYGFEDGYEVHVGGEYAFYIKDIPLFVRAGLYSDPDNSLHFWGDRLQNDLIRFGPTLTFPVDQVFENFTTAQQAAFPKRRTDYHKTFGVGLIIKNHLIMDFAADLSRDTDYIGLSVLYNF